MATLTQAGQASETPPQQVDFDPAGDVLFTVGPNDAAMVFRVSSKVVSTASDVFRAMLGPILEKAAC